MAAKIKRNDTVMVITGREKGKTGKVIRVLTDTQRVVVEGVNLVKRHQRPRGLGQQGGIIEKEAPLHVSNVMLVDPDTNKPERTRFTFLNDGRKVRVGIKSGRQYD